MSNPIINLGELAKPATVLIEKIFDAAGVVFQPHQIRRVAKANADAAMIEAQAEIDVTNLKTRAMHRLIEEEIRRQANIESIASKAIPLLESDSDPQLVNDDWIANFFDKSRIVSDEQMQIIWSKLLAGEANKPGAYSKRTINILAELNREDASLFTQLCRFICKINQTTVPLILDSRHQIYRSLGLEFETLTHLDVIGLITYDPVNGFKEMDLPKNHCVRYFDSKLDLEMERRGNRNQMEIGEVLLTQMGLELSTISGAQPIGGFMDFLRDKWRRYLPSQSVNSSDDSD